MVFGAFIAQLDDAYQRSIWRGITARARETGHGLICFMGQRLDAPDATERSRNIAYRLAGGENIDGLIVLSSTIGTFRGIEGVRALLAGQALPQVSVGLDLPGLPSVSVHGTPAMVELVRHLIKDHRRRRLALIAGPHGHDEAEERERVFRAELAAHGLDFPETLLARGSFLTESGAEAAQQLLASGEPFDALVCLNDRMAIGAMGVLRAAGRRIPEDVLVTGFDDIGEARWQTPPLTTVNQPLEAMGRAAVDMLLGVLAGGAPAKRVLDCGLVRRQSCGCAPGRFFDAPAETGPADRVVLESLAASAAAGRDAFLSRLDAALAAEQDLPRWHGALRALDGPGLPLDEAHALVAAAGIRRQAAARIAAEDQHLLIRRLSARLAGAFGMEPMVCRLAEGLADLGIRCGCLAIFGPEAGPDGLPAQARLVMAHRPERASSMATGPEAAPFPSRQLVPAAFREALARGVWILEPLVYQAEVLGYLILECDERDPTVYENLRDQVSSTLKGTLLLEAITRHEQQLEGEVARRTAELRRANRDLTAEIAQRRVLEREVQEISDRTMRSIGQDLHDDLCQHLAGIGLFAALLEGELGTAPQATVEAAKRIRRLLEEAVTRTRQIARGLYPPGLEERGLVAALEDLVDSLRRSSGIKIELQPETDFAGLPAAQAVQVFRIIQESLGNAIRHSGSDLVMVRLFRQNGRATAEIRDFGRGMVEPGGPAGGNGMGLRIMRYRAESIGAELTVRQLDPGVCIACQLAGHG